MPHILSDDEKRFFREQGYLILRGAVETDLMDRVEDQLWGAVDLDRDDPAAWIGRTNIRLDRPDETHRGALLDLSGHPNVWGVAQQFVGEGVMRGPSGMDVLIRWPNPEADWSLPGRGHIDGYNIRYQYNPFTIGVTVYGRPVEHRGGAFIFWPGSHRKAWEYFRTHSWLDFDGRDPFTPNDALGGSVGSAEEFIGEPGDLFFWHYLLTHTGSANAGRDVRFGLISRFTRHDQRDIVAERPADMWKYWDGLQG